MRLSRLLLVCALVAIPVYGGLVYGYRHADEAPDPRLTQTLAEIEAASTLPGNGYYAYFGLGALGPQGPDAVGRRLDEWDRQNRVAKAQGLPTTPEDSLGISWIELREGWRDIACSLGAEGGCLGRVAAAGEAARALLAEAQPLLAQYDTLSGYPIFRPSHVPMEMLMAKHPLGACQIDQVRIVLLALDGDPSGAAKDLSAGMALWRRILRQQEITLIDRVFAIAAVGMYAQTASDLLREGKLGPAEAQVVAEAFVPLREEERQMNGTLKMEGAFVANAVLTTLDVGDLAGNPEDSSERAVYSVLHAFYQKNWMANRSFRDVIAYEPFDRMTAREFTEKRPGMLEAIERSRRPIGFTQYLFNGVGVLMARTVPPPDYARYIARSHDYGAYVRVVGLQARIVAAGVPDEKIPAFIAAAGPGFFDPYTERPMGWDPSGGTLTFATDDQKLVKMLPVRVRAMTQ